jgi:SWI/SNF-related matrix-associated actin-dependent regulator of chromatin subfamily A member 5
VHTVYVPLSPAQRFWYKRLLTRADTITLSEIFTAAPPTLANIKAEGEEDAKDSSSGEVQIRENVAKAIAASKAGGEGNAWMKMMNL